MLILEKLLKNAKVPLIINAHAINCLAENPKLLKNYQNNIILTLNLGEMGRLTEKSAFEISEKLIEETENYAIKNNLVCILKDTRTVVAD